MINFGSAGTMYPFQPIRAVTSLALTLSEAFSPACTWYDNLLHPRYARKSIPYIPSAPHRKRFFPSSSSHLLHHIYYLFLFSSDPLTITLDIVLSFSIAVLKITTSTIYPVYYLSRLQFMTAHRIWSTDLVPQHERAPGHGAGLALYHSIEAI